MRGLILSFIGLMAVAHLAVAAPAADLACRAAEQAPPPGFTRFADDIGFDVQVRPSLDGSHLRITGDTVVVDSQTLGSLVTPSGMAKTGVARLTIDARVLRIRGPLSLEGGELVLFGERVVFEQGGEVTLAKGKRPRSLRIVAQTLAFADGPDRPFFIDLSGHADKDVEASIRAVQVTPSAALWQRFVDAYLLDEVPARVSLITGKQAEPEVAKVFASSMQWPLYFAAKLRTHFQRSPYSKQTRDEIGQLARTYQPLLGRWGGAIPLATATAVMTAAAGATDLEGRSRAFTPKEDLISQRDNVRKDLDSNTFDSLIGLLAASGNDRAAADQKLEETRKVLAEARQTTARKQQEVTERSARLSQLDQSKQALSDRAKQRSASLQLMNERDLRRERRGAEAKQWATVAAGAVVIAASFGAATPAVAAGAATGLSVTGDLVYAHNAGRKMTLPEVFARGQAAYQNAQAFQASLSHVAAAEDLRARVAKGETVKKGPPPEEGKEDKREAYTKTEATLVLFGALGTMTNAAGKLNGEDVAAPTPLSLSERENQDQEMRAVLADMAAVEKERALEAQQIASASRELALATTKAVELEELDVQLRAANAANDQEAARWHAAGLLLWSAQVERLSGKLATYRRSLYFESGRTPGGVPEVLDYPNAMQARIAAGLLDPFGGVGSEAPTEARKAALSQSKTRFLLSANELWTSIAETYRSYLQTRNEADVYRRVFDFSARSGDPVVRRFIEALNGQIAQQIVTGTPARSIAPLYVPLRLTPPVIDLPERVVAVRVVAVKFNVPREAIGNGALSFIVVHPNYGQMRRGAECFPADFRIQPTDWRPFTTTLEQVDQGWPSRDTASIKIDEKQSNRYYAYLPARTPYHLLVEVVSQKWTSLPRIEKLSLALEIMQ